MGNKVNETIPTTKEMLEKMLIFVIRVCDNENATPAELEAMPRVAAIVKKNDLFLN